MKFTGTLFVSLALLTGGFLLRAEAQPGPLEDHFKVYNAGPPINLNFPTSILLIVQFSDRQFDFFEFEKFGVPVEKNQEPLFVPERHQTWWRITEAQPTRKVVLDSPRPIGQRHSDPPAGRDR